MDQRLVHRTKTSEVFLLDAEVRGDRMWAWGAVPSCHSRMPSLGGAVPEIVVLEIFRQAGFVMAHEGVGMPFGWHLVTMRFGMNWRTAPPSVAPLSAFWFDLTGAVSIQRRSGDPYRLQFRAELICDEVVAADGWIDAYCLTPTQYRALRRRTRPPETGAVGTDDLDPDATSSWAVPWDQNDPFLFNRPGDHVVSMAMIEAVLSAATEPDHPDRRPVSIDMTFGKFGELTTPITLTPAHPARSAQRAWDLNQTGQVIAHAVTTTGIPGALGRADY